MTRRIIILFLCLFLLALVGCEGMDKKQGNNTIRIGVMPDMVSLPFILGQQESVFEEHGVDVEITVFRSAGERDAALQAGALDAVSADLLAAFFYTEGGLDLRITSTTDIECLIVSNAETEIEDIKNLESKSIGISYNTIMEYFADIALEQESVQAEKISVPAIPVRLEMLKAGEIDAAALPEPLGTSAIVGGAKKVVSSSDIDINLGVMLFTDVFIQENEELLQDFYKAYSEAFESIDNDKLAEYKGLIMEELLFPENVFGVLNIENMKHPGLPGKKDFELVEKWLLDSSLIRNEYEYDDIVYKIKGIS